MPRTAIGLGILNAIAFGVVLQKPDEERPFLSRGESVQFRLSTIFLLTLCCAILLGWYVERTSRNRRDIIGTWYYPTNDVSLMGYSSLLEIRRNGTFTKIQGYRTHSVTYDGTYAVEDNGRVSFHVTSRKTSYISSESETEELDSYYFCRCAVDPTGYLVIDVDDLLLPSFIGEDIGIPLPLVDKDIGIEWETCARETNSVIVGRKK